MNNPNENLDSLKEIGPRVKARRESLGMNVETLAEKAFLTPARLTEIEGGVLEGMTMPEVLNLGIALKAEITEITGWTYDPDSDWTAVDIDKYYR